METQAEYKTKNEKKLLSYDISEFTEKENEHMAIALFECRPDLNDLDDILIVQRDKEFKIFAVVVIFRNELMIKCRGAGVEKYYDEKLGIHKERDRETDWEVSIPKNNLTSISVNRADLCVCENCMANRDVTESDEQPDVYEINFHVGGESHVLQCPDREMAFQYKEWIMQWLMDGRNHKKNKHK